MCVNKPALEPSKTSGADCFVRGSASPSMRERRINRVMMPYVWAQLQAPLPHKYWFSLKIRRSVR